MASSVLFVMMVTALTLVNVVDAATIRLISSHRYHFRLPATTTGTYIYIIFIC